LDPKPLARWAKALKAILELHIASTCKLAEGFDDSWLFFQQCDLDSHEALTLQAVGGKATSG
jgi:hypothetical protein